jgi:hypothetical protein
MDVKQLEEIKDFLVQIAHDAGDMITTAHPTTGASGSKKNCKSRLHIAAPVLHENFCLQTLD